MTAAKAQQNLRNAAIRTRSPKCFGCKRDLPQRTKVSEVFSGNPEFILAQCPYCKAITPFLRRAA